MRSVYRRQIKIHLIDASKMHEAHGWASTEDEQGHEVRHYFRCDQQRFLHHIRQSMVAVMRIQLERQGIHPKSISIKRPFGSFTYKNLSYHPERAANHATIDAA